MPKLPRSSRLASPVDTTAYGTYRIVRRPDDPRPLYRFSDHVVDKPQSGRYHIYAGWFCPWSQRVVIAHALAGLQGIVTVSYVDNARDGRGWAFRERYGPDPVNGFRLLRQAYEATEEGFDGHISVPTLWDRSTARVVSNDFKGIGIDLATRFQHLATPIVNTYPEAHRAEIEELDAWLNPAVNRGVLAAEQPGPDGERARTALHEALAALDQRLAGRRYLLGPDITEADIRLFVTLVRFGAGITRYPDLWAYARDLYTVPAFRDSTDFTTFTPPGAELPDWSEPVRRPAYT
ncbi:glutathione S-transferase C-terminal domain-containing protein [Dactylosporangium sp. NPDC000555]|uniref:glutathione S-transferase C-terminal domain-containing protein n=1 Tax=Dactylosporangium sp. NPDC000555 TaxID=3154260 RepID=UPI00332B4AE3